MRVSCLLVRSSDFLTSVSRTWVSVIISFQERRARLLQMCLELSIVSRRNPVDINSRGDLNRIPDTQLIVLLCYVLPLIIGRDLNEVVD